APAPPLAPPRPVTPPPPAPESASTVMLTPPPPTIISAPEPAPVEPTVRMEPTVAEAPPVRARSAGPALVYPPSRPRPEPAKPAPSPSRPSKDDLAALDVLLNPKSHETPMAPLDPGGREEPWGAQFGEAEPRRLPGGVIVGAGVLLLALVVGAGFWYYRENPNAFAFGRGSRETPSTTLAAATPPTTLFTPATTLPPAPSTTLAPAPT